METEHFCNWKNNIDWQCCDSRRNICTHSKVVSEDISNKVWKYLCWVISLEQYLLLKWSGMMWEFHPEATWDYNIDKFIINLY